MKYIIIPLGGHGERFKNFGWTIPKALIPVNKKPIIFWLLDNLNLNDCHVIIPFNRDEYSNLDSIISNQYPNVKFTIFPISDTIGAAETISLALRYIPNKAPFISIDADNFYKTDIITTWSTSNNKNMVFYFTDRRPDPKFSYITLVDGNVDEIAEKIKISDNACCGAYGFSSAEAYQTIFRGSLQERDGETYISRIISKYLEPFQAIRIRNCDYHSLGTPEQIYRYMTPFLMDLDGTMVNTDSLYVEVWDELLSNLVVNEAFFKAFIRGNSDKVVLAALLPEATVVDIQQVSTTKDRLFCEKANMYNVAVVPGLLDFLENHKDHPMVIVTNSNQSSAQKLIELTGIDEYIRIIVAADHVTNNKPSPDPYIYAAEFLESSCEECIIFEDSNTGYQSAVAANPWRILLVNSDIKNPVGTIFIRENYNNLTIDYNKALALLPYLYTALSHLPIRYIRASKSNLKPGYISDISSFKAYYNSEQVTLVTKTSERDNVLAEVAETMDMYNLEKLFYDDILPLICHDINTPLCYATFTLPSSQICIIMNDVTDKPGNFGVDLTKNIRTFIDVIDRIGHIHRKYYFKNEAQTIGIFRKLKTVSETYPNFIRTRYEHFIPPPEHASFFNRIRSNFDAICDRMSTYPLSLCHGDLKSPNLYYASDGTITFLDWQYIHLGKGISDITFLLVESIPFDEYLVNMILLYYYNTVVRLTGQSYVDYIQDFKDSLCIMTFFVIVWFNTVDKAHLLDVGFPERFTEGAIKYYSHYFNK